MPDMSETLGEKLKRLQEEAKQRNTSYGGEFYDAARKAELVAFASNPAFADYVVGLEQSLEHATQAIMLGEDEKLTRMVKAESTLAAKDAEIEELKAERDEMCLHLNWLDRHSQTVRVYNYPWSGRLGRIADCCMYCGDNGPSFQLSSHGDRCLSHECPSRNGGDPKPELVLRFDEEYKRRARAWCKNNGIDFDAVRREMWQSYSGPPNQPSNAQLAAATKRIGELEEEARLLKDDKSRLMDRVTALERLKAVYQGRIKRAVTTPPDAEGSEERR